MTRDLAIETACASLMAQTIFFADRYEVDGFVRLFHTDGWVELKGQKFEGREAITRFMSQRDPQRLVRHVLGTPCIHVTDQQHATGIAYYTLYEGRADAGPKVAPLKLPAAVGEFHQTYGCGPDGWRILSHRSVRIFQAAPEAGA